MIWLLIFSFLLGSFFHIFFQFDFIHFFFFVQIRMNAWVNPVRIMPPVLMESTGTYVSVLKDLKGNNAKEVKEHLV